jgi:threonine dehydrogenase-like Zn-dependent dehydrogenase
MGLVHVLEVSVVGAGDIIAFDRWDFRLTMAKSFGADVALECTDYHEAVRQGVQMVRRGGMHIVAGVFADVGSITLISQHIAAHQVCIAGICTPSRGYPASMKLVEKFNGINPLQSFITLRSRVEDVAAPMAQVQELNACMKVVITP